MRNQSLLNTAALTFLGIALFGCNVDRPAPAPNPQLTAGYSALNQKDYEQAIEHADNFLRANPHGPGSAEALYLKGRALEEKFEQNGDPDTAELKHDQLEARTAYEEALDQHPSTQTEGYIRASLSNVAFFQDDYPTALSEASRAYALSDPYPAAIQSILLFRMAESEQRMGRFTDADRTFQLVQKRYPNPEVARLAHDQTGMRSFYVQLATFNSAGGAERAMASLQSSQVAISKHNDANGHTIVDAGPYPSYDAAREIKVRFAQQYPDAIIVP